MLLLDKPLCMWMYKQMEEFMKTVADKRQGQTQLLPENLSD